MVAAADASSTTIDELDPGLKTVISLFSRSADAATPDLRQIRICGGNIENDGREIRFTSPNWTISRAGLLWFRENLPRLNVGVRHCPSSAVTVPESTITRSLASSPTLSLASENTETFSTPKARTLPKVEAVPRDRQQLKS